MYILFIIVILNNASINTEHLYFESLEGCTQAAQEVQEQNRMTLLYRVRAFCIKGD